MTPSVSSELMAMSLKLKVGFDTVLPERSFVKSLVEHERTEPATNAAETMPAAKSLIFFIL